jgi:hypothetical protein
MRIAQNGSMSILPQRRKFAPALALTVVTLIATARAEATPSLGPNPALTPGAWHTPPTPLAKLCAANYPASARKVSAATKARVMRAYGYDAADSARFEIDHLVALGLDGTNEPANLWPEPIAAAHRKDVLERALRRDVCSGRRSLRDAQVTVAQDWQAAYRTVLRRRRP